MQNTLHTDFTSDKFEGFEVDLMKEINAAPDNAKPHDLGCSGSYFILPGNIFYYSGVRGRVCDLPSLLQV